MLRLQDSSLRPGEPAPQEKLEQLEKILRSRVFQGSDLLATLLQYLVRQAIEDPESQAKEYTIALEVFGRDSAFDPRTNSIVRVQAKNLRAKLQAYYETEGKADRILLEVPKGHYKVVFSYLSPPEGAHGEGPAPDEARLAAVPAEAAAPQPAARGDFTVTVLTVTIVVLSIVVVLLALPNFTARRPRAAPPPGAADTEVWAPFLRSDATTLLVLSNPPVYRFLNNSDARVVAEEAVELSPRQVERLSRAFEDKLVMKQGGPPRLVLSTSNYTGIGEAIGLYHLTDLFRSAGRDLILKQSRTVAADDLKNRHVILLGSAWVNDWVEKLPVKEDFVYTVDASIENKDPQPGEEREYKPKYHEQTGQVQEDYALITVRPGVTEEHRVMILAGLLSEGTQAAAEYVTRKEYLGELSRRLRQMADADGPPKYYQVLLKVSVDNGIPTTVSMLAVHPLKVTRN